MIERLNDAKSCEQVLACAKELRAVAEQLRTAEFKGAVADVPHRDGTMAVSPRLFAALLRSWAGNMEHYANRHLKMTGAL